jgi:hypothetical protein
MVFFSFLFTTSASFIVLVLGIELKALHMLSTCSAAELHSQPHFFSFLNSKI